MKKYFTLLFTMLKIGLFTIGGGYAMIALLEEEFVQKKKFLSKEEFLDMVAIAESTPGPIAINAATYIGYKEFGFFGSLFATVGIGIPSFSIVFLISLFFDEFISIPFVAYAFRGIQVCVVYLIFSAGIRMIRSMKKTVFSLTVLSSVILCMVAFSLFAVKFSSVLYIIICGGLGIFAYLIGSLRRRREIER